MSESHSSPIQPRRLPQHPNLEQLRRQAKELLESYRAADPAAIAEVDRFDHLPHPQNFALHDAQRVLSRAYGFASWTRLKAFVDGANIARFAEAVQSGDIPQVRAILSARPELIAMDRAANDEHRALHYAVLRRDAPMVKLLMEAGADARKGIHPHRDATTALTLARDREFDDIVALIEAEEHLRREEMSCPNAAVSPIQDQISKAILQGDTPAALQWLRDDLSLIQACDRDGASPLHLAAQQANAELAKWLLDRRASVHKKDPHGLTPLDRAALAADPRNSRAKAFPAMAQLLLQHGAQLTLRAAVALGDQSSVRQGLQSESSLLRAVSWGGGLVSLAVKHNQPKIVELLLDLGADVDERVLLEELEEPTFSWGTPLWYAALAGDLALTRLLLDRGADPNANVYASGWPLMNAWDHEDQSVKQLLLARGARMHPYMVARVHDIVQAKRLLAESPSEETVSELAWSAADHGCPEIVELAVQHLPWPAADARWHWVIIQPMRGAGDDSIANEGHFRSMAALLQHGVDPNVSRFGQTALHFAAARHGGLSGADRARFAAMLLDHGAKLDLRDDLLQSTPLGWACRWGRTELVELLLQRGAPVHEPDAQPWATPLAWATKMQHTQLLTILKRARH